MPRRGGELRAWWALWRRALRWRRASATALAAVAVVAVAAAAFGPVYLRAADDSTLTSTLQTAALGSTDVTVVASGGSTASQTVRTAMADAARLGAGRWFAAPIVSVDGGVTVVGAGQSYVSDLLSRTGLCAHVPMVSGSCPAGSGQVAMSIRSARLAGIRLGQSVAVKRPNGAASLRVKVVGLYDPPTDLLDQYWVGDDYFSLSGTAAAPRIDALLTTAATALSATRLGVVPQTTGFVRLLPGVLGADQVGRFQSAVRTFEQQIGTRYALSATSGLTSIFAGARHSESLMGTVVEAIDLQLVLLSLLVLYALVDISGRDRRLEADIARRRGFTRLSLLAVAVGEPVILLVFALPVGVLLAWAAVAVVGPDLFVAGTPVALDGLGILTALGGFFGGVLATVVASWSLWHGADRPGDTVSRNRSTTAALDALAVALAGAGLVALSSRGSLAGSTPDPVAALAPGLLAIGAGVVGLRLAALAFRGLLRLTRTSPRLAMFLAVREVARRRPSPLRQVLPLTAAVVLAVFAVDSWALADTNRATVAAFDVGAARVADVRLAPGVDLAQAVDDADPSGRQAMAVAVYTANSGQLLAVQADRLAQVASWPSALSTRSVAAIARYLDPPTPPALTFRGQALQIRATLPAGAPTTDLSATVFNEAQEDEATVDIGPLRAGTGTYTGSLEGFCTSTCRLVDLSPAAATIPGGTPDLIRLSLQELTVVGGQGSLERLLLGGERSWRAAPASVAVTAASGGGISFLLPTAELSTQGIVLSPADIPAAIPAVVTTGLTADNTPQPPNDSLSVTGLDGNVLNLSAGIRVASLPQIGDNAAMVDLGFAQLAEIGISDATYQVWLAASAPTSILDALRADGVTVTAIKSAAGRRGTLDKGPLALGYTFVLFSAPVGSLLAVGATAFGILSSGRRRRSELRSLSVVGLGWRTLHRSVLLETGTVLGVAWLLGGVVGIAASRLALSSLPQFPDGTGGVPLSHAVQLVPLIAVLGGLVLVFAGTAAVTSRLIVGRSSALNNLADQQ